MIPKDGDYVVLRSRWDDAEVVRAIRVTNKICFYVDPYYKRERRVRMDDIVFAGPESIANKLAEQLKSSVALYNEECRKSYDRREKRNAEYIEKAISSLTSAHREGEQG